MTLAEYRRFNPGLAYRTRYAPDADGPVIDVRWYEAAAYCNWLSQREGIPEDQDGPGIVDDLDRIGHRAFEMGEGGAGHEIRIASFELQL